MGKEQDPAFPEANEGGPPAERRDAAPAEAEEALGDRLADIDAAVERSVPPEPTLDALEAAADGVMPVPDDMKKEASAIDAAIASLKAKMKGVLGSVEGALKGRRAFDYEYRDAQGRVVCRVKAELGVSRKRLKLDTADGREGRGRILHSLILEGEKDGRPVSVDALRLANSHGVPVLVGTERLENSAYDFDERQAIVSSLETPFDLATLFHELGHADQSMERRFAGSGITDLRQPEASKPNSADLPADEIEEILNKVAAAIPEVEQVIDKGIVAKIRAIEAGMKEIVLDSPENARKVDALYDEKKALIEELRVDDMALLPKRMLERDATRRAYVWLRELREQGIDLLGKFPLPEGEEATGGCGQAMERGEGQDDASAEMTIREALGRSLGTYKAERTRFKKPGAGGPGIRPAAGGRRKI